MNGLRHTRDADLPLLPLHDSERPNQPEDAKPYWEWLKDEIV